MVDTGTRKIAAKDLKVGQGVKAPGAPAFSTILEVKDLPEGIGVRLDWGALIYEPSEEVETGHNCPECHGTKQTSFVRDGKWHVERCGVCN